MLLLPSMAHVGDDLLFLSEVLDELRQRGIDSAVLFRASEMDKLGRLREHGTDRGGYPGGRMWRGRHPEGPLPHEDFILATTAEDIRRGCREPGYSTSFKKFPLHPAPLLLIYDAGAFEPVADKEYRFRHPGKKADALVAAIPIQMRPAIEGWMPADEGLGYRDLVQAALEAPGARGLVVEVGSWKGRSTTWIAGCVRRRGGRVIAIDHFAGSTDRYDAQYRERLAAEDVPAAFARNMEPFGDTVELVRARSLDAAATLDRGSVDLVFLDASHDHDSVLAELAAFEPALRPGGILCGHDLDDEHPEVGRAVREHARKRGGTVAVGPGSIWRLLDP